jgi:hypothetical protein
LRDTEIRGDKAKRAKRAQIWRAKKTADLGKSAAINM